MNWKKAAVKYRLKVWTLEAVLKEISNDKDDRIKFLENRLKAILEIK